MNEVTPGKMTWKVGQRVVRMNSTELGTVVHEGPIVKVKWDDGATSYYNGKRPANVRLVSIT